MPAVSVLMPTYNAESTIDEALSSILAQTLKDIEIIIVDDGSTDNTLSLINKWKKTDKITFNVKVPANSSALVYLPTAYPTRVRENGKGIKDVKGIEFIRIENVV